MTMTRWTVCLTCLCCAVVSVAQPAPGGKENVVVLELENAHARLAIAADGTCVRLADRKSGADYARHDPSRPLAGVTVAGVEHVCTRAEEVGGSVRLGFGATGVSADLKIEARGPYFLFTVAAVRGDVSSLRFLDIPLTLAGELSEPFAACALARDLRTNVAEMPGPNSLLRATCYPRFGMVGASAAVVACPPGEMREAIKQVVTEAPELPKSSVGGPWAMDPQSNRGSYLFNFGGLTVGTADQWVARARSLGFTQIDCHGGGSFRFGDCFPNPETYPRGRADLKAAIDRLHAGGILAGLHTYAFFIDKRCPWVTPVPDRRLATDTVFTLAQAMSPDTPTLPVVESTGAMSTITGFFVHNSVTFRIDDELVVYGGINKQPPYAFTGCQRGACGTKAASHAAGARAYHLKECFGLLVPDPESTLFEEVAQATADTYNECGFDMMYLDALDGEAILGGWEWAWHYGSRFVFEICKRLKRPAIMEMSTFHHHLWYVRSRAGAWDHPTRTHKQFIDMHVQGNEANERMFLPSELGWWAFQSFGDPQTEPTFPDDIEYLCAKAIGTGSGLAITSYDTASSGDRRLAAIVKRYEDLRNSGQVPERIKALLRQPGADFTLEGSVAEGWRLRPVQATRHKVDADWARAWQVSNPYGLQTPGVRIEALRSVGSWDDPGNIILFDCAAPMKQRAANDGVTLELTPDEPAPPGRDAFARLTATNRRTSRTATWAQIARVFSPPAHIGAYQGLGVWVYGDGKGELLNFQMQSPQHITSGIGEHYIKIDFEGWRYFELVEGDCEQYASYQWPYGGAYAIYRELVAYPNVETVSLWVNNLPAKDTITCYLRPVKALPLTGSKLVNPSLTLGGHTVTFPVTVETGSYLELRSMSDCKLYGPQGQLLCEVQPRGWEPVLQPGENPVQFTTEAVHGATPRALVTLFTRGEPL